MKKTFCAGALALAMVVLLSNITASHASDAGFDAAQSQGAASINIGRIKSVLKLTPDQERYWAPVEAALLQLARQQAREEPAGFMRRISRRVVSVVLNGAAVQRLAGAARPLLAVLDDDQKRAAAGLAQEMGLGPVVAALN